VATARGLRLNVRRLAALDMYGVRGTRRRRRIILAEYVFGAVGGVAFGAWAFTWGGVAGVIVGLCLLGLAANYAALTAHVVSLWPPGRLEDELAGADVRAELRYYTGVQLWVLVPFWVAALAVIQARAPR
jgi:hypothetical protein